MRSHFITRSRLKPRIRLKSGRWEMDKWIGIIDGYPKIAISHSTFREAAEYFRSISQKEAY